MMAPIKVKGADAHPLFKTLAEKSSQPTWNFNKFVVSADGESVSHFGAQVSPKNKKLSKAIDKIL
jgi:glutathione peroxidase